MPLIEVTYDDTTDEPLLRHLGQLLPEVVSEAVNCPEDPCVGSPNLGDIEIRFRKKSAFDVGGLNVVVEVRTKLFKSRLADKQRRADLIRDRVSTLGLGKVGVWLILTEGAWSQDEQHVMSREQRQRSGSGFISP